MQQAASAAGTAGHSRRSLARRRLSLEAADLGRDPLGQEPDCLQVVAVDEVDEVLEPGTDEASVVGCRLGRRRCEDCLPGDVSHPRREELLDLLGHPPHRFRDHERVRRVRAQDRPEWAAKRRAVAL